MSPIISEMLMLVRQGAKQIDLPRRRLSEFLIAATDHKFLTMEQVERLRLRCIRGEAKAFGVPVKFN